MSRSWNAWLLAPKSGSGGGTARTVGGGGIAAAACSDACHRGGRVEAGSTRCGQARAQRPRRQAGRLEEKGRQGWFGGCAHREAHIGRLLALSLWRRVSVKVRGLRQRGALRHTREGVARAVRRVHHSSRSGPQLFPPAPNTAPCNKSCHGPPTHHGRPSANEACVRARFFLSRSFVHTDRVPCRDS